MTPDSIFVYGTLKRGEVRESCWPRPPLQVQTAVVRGTLYDLGPYPALTSGDDRVAGELWILASADLAPTLAALDAIEGFANSPSDWYLRRTILCELPTGETVTAWTYLLARPEQLAAATRMEPSSDGLCRWTGGDAARDDFARRRR